MNHLQTLPHLNSVRRREACPCLYLLKAGPLQWALHRDSWQEHPETAIHPELRCQDPDDSP